jgi:hypothetical protein
MQFWEILNALVLNLSALQTIASEWAYAGWNIGPIRILQTGQIRRSGRWRHPEGGSRLCDREVDPLGQEPGAHSDAQVGQIAASIAEFGFNNPILVDTKAGIIADNQLALDAGWNMNCLALSLPLWSRRILISL